jgi:hypothetical protein
VRMRFAQRAGHYRCTHLFRCSGTEDEGLVAAKSHASTRSTRPTKAPPYWSRIHALIRRAAAIFQKIFRESQGRLKLGLKHGSCLCQTDSAFALTTMTLPLLNCATVRGDRCSDKGGQAPRRRDGRDRH